MIPSYFMITKHSFYYNNPSVATNQPVLICATNHLARGNRVPPPWLCLICLLLCDVAWQAERQMESMEEDAIAALTLMSGVGKGEVRASSPSPSPSISMCVSIQKMSVPTYITGSGSRGSN
jgi:hypothetical protein